MYYQSIAYCNDQTCHCEHKYPGVTLYDGENIAKAMQAIDESSYTGYDHEMMFLNGIDWICIYYTKGVK